MTFLFIFEVDSEATNWKRVAQSRSAREENVSIELMVASSHFNYNLMRPCCQSHKLIKVLEREESAGKLRRTY